jgi:adenylate cyclase
VRSLPRAPDEFTGKILIIGSTAAGLHDVKGTPLDRQFPGVEILATAIDNVRGGDWIRAPTVKWFYLLVTLTVIWGTAFAFYRSGAGTKVDQFYGLSAIALLGFSYATVNLGNLYINLAGPVALGALYFSVARIYAFATERALDNSMVARTEAQDGPLRGLLLVLHFPVETREESALEKLSAQLARGMKREMSIELLQDRQRGLWRLFENTLVICWAHVADDDAGWQAIRAEADTLVAALPKHINDAGVAAALPPDTVVIRRSEGRIRGQQPGDWRLLFAAALLEEGKNA